ncbi:protein phosphatase CheZ, partial [Mucilaginibacter sp. 10I4]|nr:protein phosphatase CheZ [Mucilaginibacter sp. 10I4]
STAVECIWDTSRNSLLNTSDAAHEPTRLQLRGHPNKKKKYIATLTEQAANKVLTPIDEGMPAQDELAKQARDMDSRWTQLYDGKLSVDEFKVLAADSR